MVKWANKTTTQCKYKHILFFIPFTPQRNCTSNEKYDASREMSKTFFFSFKRIPSWHFLLSDSSKVWWNKNKRVFCSHGDSTIIHPIHNHKDRIKRAKVQYIYKNIYITLERIEKTDEKDHVSINSQSLEDTQVGYVSFGSNKVWAQEYRIYLFNGY